MEITGINEGATSDLTSTLGSARSLGKDAFMNLLITQLKNQDPLAPQDSIELVAQLAQLSNLEQLTDLNERTEELKSIQANSNEMMLLNYLGKNILFEGNTFQVKGEESISLPYMLAQDAAEVKINIRNADGILVKALSFESQKAGNQEILFVPEDHDGKPLEEGEYFFEVEAMGQDGETVSTFTLSQGHVTEIATLGGTPYVLLGNIKVRLGDIIRIQE